MALPLLPLVVVWVSISISISSMLILVVGALSVGVLFFGGPFLGLEEGGVGAAWLGSRAAASERGLVKRMSTWV